MRCMGSRLLIDFSESILGIGAAILIGVEFLSHFVVGFLDV
jgi:hypothetical protein